MTKKTTAPAKKAVKTIKEPALDRGAPRLLAKVVRLTVSVSPTDSSKCHSSCTGFEYAGLTTAFCNTFVTDLTGDTSSATRCAECIALFAK